MTLDLRRVDSTIQYYKDLGTRIPGKLAAALTEGAKTGQSAARALILQKVPLKDKTLTKGLHVVPATPATLEARLQARPLRIPLIAYLDIRGGLRSGQGIGGRAYALGTVPGRGFLAKMPSGHRGVYARTGRARLPIRELMGPSLPTLVSRYGIFQSILPAVNAAVRLRALGIAKVA
jgi:hypothetical protein